MAQYLVIDNGGTFIKPSIMDENGEIITILPKVPSNVMSTNAYDDFSGKDSEAGFKGKVDSVEKYLEVIDEIYEPYKGKVDGIAMSFPGVNNADTGYCYSGGSFFFADGQPMGEIMTKHYGIPVTIENDGKCAAQAEYWKGALKGVTNGAVIVLGTGVGGGIIINGEILRGPHFSAGEMSYMTNDVGHPEDMATTFSMDAAMGMCMAVAYAKGLNPAEVDGFKVFELAKEGDPVVLGILDKVTSELVGQAYNMTTLMDLELVAIGGGISREQMLIDMLVQKAEHLNANNPSGKYSAFFPKVYIAPCTFHNEANMVGALYHHLKIRGLLPKE